MLIPVLALSKSHYQSFSEAFGEIRQDEEKFTEETRRILGMRSRTIEDLYQLVQILVGTSTTKRKLV